MLDFPNNYGPHKKLALSRALLLFGRMEEFKPLVELLERECDRLAFDSCITADEIKMRHQQGAHKALKEFLRWVRDAEKIRDLIDK